MRSALPRCTADGFAIGGILSHPAIIARELRIPAVVATGAGTSVLHDGDIVVDGEAGTVRRLS